ncbi:hypothetical protein [Streptomyces sp. NPDC046385]|uniref:hypothetical protein n=1 Tax=Streptomyces sp. NPDC046385 TaxID=3154918 RepID=UPI0033C0977A
MPSPNAPRPTRRTWAYAATAVLVLALNQGWAAADVIKLATAVLVLIALIIAAGHGSSGE